MNKNLKIGDFAKIIDSYNNYITNNIYYIGIFSNIKGFLSQINGRTKELNLLGENYYVSLDFFGGLNINSILQKKRCIIIGNPGSGKTQLLVDIFFKIKNSLNKKWGYYKNNDFLPFFIALSVKSKDIVQ